VDKSGQCALVHAALRGHSEVIECLLEQSWSTEGQHDLSLKNKALQQGFIVACSMGHIHVSAHTHTHTHTHANGKTFLLKCTSAFYEGTLFFRPQCVAHLCQMLHLSHKNNE